MYPPTPNIKYPGENRNSHRGISYYRIVTENLDMQNVTAVFIHLMGRCSLFAKSPSSCQYCYAQNTYFGLRIQRFYMLFSILPAL